MSAFLVLPDRKKTPVTSTFFLWRDDFLPSSSSLPAFLPPSHRLGGVSDVGRPPQPNSNFRFTGGRNISPPLPTPSLFPSNPVKINLIKGKRVWNQFLLLRRNRCWERSDNKNWNEQFALYLLLSNLVTWLTRIFYTASVCSPNLHTTVFSLSRTFQLLG